MVNGNDKYDAQLRAGLLSVDEVLAVWPDAGVVVERRHLQEMQDSGKLWCTCCVRKDMYVPEFLYKRPFQ